MRTEFQTTPIPTTTETAITPLGGAGEYINLTKLSIANTGAVDTTVTIRDTVGGSVIFTYPVKAGQTVGFFGTLETNQTTANTQWTAKCSAASTVVVSAEWLHG